MVTDAIRAQSDVTAAALAAVRDFLGGPHQDGDRWVFEFGDHLHSNWEAVYGGAIAAGSLAVARATLPEQSPRSIHVQMVRSLPSGPAHATAEVRHAGRVVGTVEVAMFDQRQKLAALSVVTMVTPAAVASGFHSLASTPPIETLAAPFADGTSEEWMPPITKALRLGNWDGDVPKGGFVSPNYRRSVDGTEADASVCTLPWDNLDDTGPEAACLLGDSLVSGQIVRSYIPLEALGPNPDLSLRFTTAPATRVITGASTLLSVQHGTATVGLEVQAGDQQLAHGLATSVLLDRT